MTTNILCYKATHMRWQSELVLNFDSKTFFKKSNSVDGGKFFIKGNNLILKWFRSRPEFLITNDDRKTYTCKSYKFVLELLTRDGSMETLNIDPEYNPILNSIKKIYIISLKNSTRRINMERQLKQKRIWHMCEFIDGVLIKDNIDIFDELKIHQNASKLPPGDLGCLFAHLRAIKKIIDNNLEYAIVLEDDIIINNRALLYFLSNEDKYLGHDLTFIHPHVNYGTQGQIISLEGAKKIYENRMTIIKLNIPIDMYYFYHSRQLLNIKKPNSFYNQAIVSADNMISERLSINMTHPIT